MQSQETAELRALSLQAEVSWKLSEKSFPRKTSCQHRLHSHSEETGRADSFPVLWAVGTQLKLSGPLLPDLENDWGQRAGSLSWALPSHLSVPGLAPRDSRPSVRIGVF